MITDRDVELYLARMLPSSAPVLAEMEEQARRRDIPIVGPVVARILHMLAVLQRARRVFELGSAIGYSTLWFADAVGEGGEVFYTDSSPANLAEARAYSQRLGLTDRVRWMQGDALTSFQDTPGDFDIVFCDLDKPQYPDVLRQAVPRIRRGGLLIADNVLWRGLVAHPPETPETAAIAEFNRLLYADKRLEVVILPVRDGVAVARVL